MTDKHTLVSPHASQRDYDPSLLEDISFEHFDVLFLGLLAKAYSDGYYSAPMQNWARGIPTRDLDINGHVIRMTEGRRKIEGKEIGGVAMTINYNMNGAGEKSQAHFFIPYSELSDISFSIKGIRG